MTKDKKITLDEAQKQKKLEQFCKERPSEGDDDKFNALLDAMAKPKSS